MSWKKLEQYLDEVSELYVEYRKEQGYNNIKRVDKENCLCVSIYSMIDACDQFVETFSQYEAKSLPADNPDILHIGQCCFCNIGGKEKAMLFNVPLFFLQ